MKIALKQFNSILTGFVLGLMVIQKTRDTAELNRKTRGIN